MFGALIVHYLIKDFGPKGVPTIVAVGLIALGIGFVLAAVEFLTASMVTVIRTPRRTKIRLHDHPLHLPAPSCPSAGAAELLRQALKERRRNKPCNNLQHQTVQADT
jgi:hypothetical protein